MPLDNTEVERALVVFAHPDDVDFGCAGTVATMTDAGIEVHYCVVTNGDSGGFDRDVARDEIPKLRQAEQRAAAKAVGVEHDHVHFLDRVDGSVVADFDLRRDISRVIRQVRPQRVLTQSPVFNFRMPPASHPDHRATGQACLDAVYPDARNPFAYPELLRDEGLEDWIVREVWVMAHQTKDHYVDVTDTFDRKMDALRSHESQMQETPDKLEQMLREWLGNWAREGGLEDGRLAEAFTVITYQ